MNNILSSSFSDTKKHYEILDGLRGVAAIIVVLYHILEPFGNHFTQIINHGYLAVDFFFVLSGFVIGYAYDDRWTKMSLKDFFKRRLIRLHPMIIIGMIIGAILFYFQDSQNFWAISGTPVSKMLLVMLIGFTLFPVGRSMDIRGWGEMHPLNGPAWSLFFEYIANILYALFIRKFSNKVLAVFVFITGALLIHMAVTSHGGDIIGGWSVNPAQLRIGFMRLLYPFFAGLLLSRIVKPSNIKYAFTWCSLLLIVVLAIPRIGGTEHLWMNGLYDSLSVIFIFPLIVYIGASGTIKNNLPLKINRFLGDISYPIYIIHYPIVYIFIAWKTNNEISSISEAIPAALLVLVTTIIIAYGSFKFYDVPVRRWLTKRFMTTKTK